MFALSRSSITIFTLAKLVYINSFPAGEEFSASKMEQRLNELIECAVLYCIEVARFCHDFADKDGMVARFQGVDDATLNMGRTLSSSGRLHHVGGYGC